MASKTGFLFANIRVFCDGGGRTGTRATMCASTSKESERPSTSSLPAWRAFHVKTGKPVGSMKDIVNSSEVEGADALLLGETHDDPVAHELEKELLNETIQAPGRTAILSMEILESDVQLVVDEFVSGLVTDTTFKSNARLPFNYASDYKPLLDMAKENGISVLAANAPRRYVALARKVGRENLKEHLSQEALKYLPPLPYAAATERYRDKFARMMALLRGEDVQGAAPEAPPGMLDAQSLWDASMAYSICSAVEKARSSASPGRPLLFHIGGSFHIEQGLGILEHLPNYSESIKVATVVIQPGNTENEIDPGQIKDVADFVVITDETTPRSY